MHRLTFASIFLLSATAALAQESHWVANRFSNDVHQLRPWGKVEGAFPTATALRRAVQAPDGKVWVIRFIQSSFDIYDSAGNLLASPVNPTGSAFDVAFDSNGHGWVSGGTSANEFDANGVHLLSYPLAASAPLGITIDTNGNKWIAHRTTPASVSRIASVTGVITNHLLPPTVMLPVVAFADYRGTGISSHIWVIGDSSGDLVEFDSAGVALNLFLTGLSNIGSLAQDLATQDLFIGSFGNGAIVRMNTSGVVLSAFTNLPSVNGLSFDSFGRLLATTRVSFSGPQPSEVRRWDITPAAPVLEVVSTIGLGAQSPVSTRRDFAMVVDQLGDADLDGLQNIYELQAGTSPWDPQSNLLASINTTGPTASGSTFSLNISAPATAVTAIAAAGGTVSPGLTVPGIGGAVLLDLATLLLDPGTGSPVLFTLPGTAQLVLTIPPASTGLAVAIQGLTVDPSFSQFTNATGVFVYL